MPKSRYRMHDNSARSDIAAGLFSAPSAPPPPTLGRDVSARNRSSGQAALITTFADPWRPALTEAQKELWRQCDHPALVSFLRSEPSVTHGTCYVYHHYRLRSFLEASDSLRADVGYQSSMHVAGFAQVADALDTLARQGLAHGALCPEALSLGADDGRIRVKDFGLRLVVRDGLMPLLDSLGDVVPYLAPEYFDQIVHGDAPEPTTASDIYALGAVMHRFFFGRPVLDADAPVREQLLAALRGDLDLADTWREHPVLTAVITRCLETDPDDRYESFAALREALAVAADAGPIFRAEDTWGLRFDEAGGREIRVLAPGLTVDPLPGKVAAGLKFFRAPTWVLTTSRRTVVCTDVRGLESLPVEATVAPNVWEFHFVQAMNDLQLLGRRAPLICDRSFARVAPDHGRLVCLYPGLRPRADAEADLWPRLASLERPVLAPELYDLVAVRAGSWFDRADAQDSDVDAAADADGELTFASDADADADAGADDGYADPPADPLTEGPAVYFDDVDLDALDPSVRQRGALYATALLFYLGMTRHVALAGRVRDGRLVRELPKAYLKERDLSVQISELLQRCLRRDPALRYSDVQSLWNDYWSRQKDPTAREQLLGERPPQPTKSAMTGRRAAAASASSTARPKGG